MKELNGKHSKVEISRYYIAWNKLKLFSALLESTERDSMCKSGIRCHRVSYPHAGQSVYTFFEKRRENNYNEQRKKLFTASYHNYIYAAQIYRYIFK